MVALANHTSETVERSDWSMFIDGEFLQGYSDETLDVVNPATGEVFASAPRGTEEDIDHAIEAAREAFEEWRWMQPKKRSKLLFEISRTLKDHHAELCELETLENGKPLYQSANDVDSAVDNFEFYGGGVDKFYSDTVHHSPDEISKKVFEPYGVVGIVIPWNWPPKHTADFLAPVLAAGNTAVLKPAPETPLSSLRIAELVADILPDGVLNVVTGETEPGAALTSHEDVDMIAFTGHDKTGEHVLKAAAENITPCMMELGGKNPELVFPDANLDKAVSGAVRNAFYNSGQACSDTERLLVHEDIVDDFLAKLAEEVPKVKVGDGFTEGVQVGPLASERQHEKIHSYLEMIENEDLEVLAQADTPSDPELEDGFWAPPTFYTGLEPGMRIEQREIFGPVVGVITFSDEEEAIEIANGTDYGLTAYAWTSDVNRANRLVSRLEAGVVGINGRSGGAHAVPFGGYKRSGVGRKADFNETMRAFSRVKSIKMDLTDDLIEL